MATKPFLALLISAALLTSGATLAQDDETPNLDEERRVEQLAAIPPKAMATARQAAPDVVFQSAESLWVDDNRVYQISGRLFREVWVVHVEENGRLLRVERDVQDD